MNFGEMQESKENIRFVKKRKNAATQNRSSFLNEQPLNVDQKNRDNETTVIISDKSKGKCVWFVLCPLLIWFEIQIEKVFQQKKVPINKTKHKKAPDIYINKQYFKFIRMYIISVECYIILLSKLFT